MASFLATGPRKIPIQMTMSTVAPMLLALYVASPQSTTHSETIELIGFSKHEDAAAFRVRVERPAPLDAGDVDRFTVIRVVNTKTGEVIGHFRQGRIRRTDANGRRARMASAELLSADNPMWLDALPAAKWKRVRRKVGFKHRRVKIKDGAIRLEPAGRGKMRFEADDTSMVVTSDAGGPIHVIPRIHLWNGSEETLAPIKVRGVENRVVRAEIRFFHSPSGYQVAAHIRLTSETPGHEQKKDFVAVQSLPESPLAVTTVGTFNTMKENHASTQGLWDDMHPETKDLYKAYVGSWGNL